MTIIFAILIFSFLIFIHELGHFLAAKLSGVRVNEFSIFMGPAIWKKQVGETLYAIRCIPLGGYCAMEGEDEDSEDPRSFLKAAWWKRLIILVAGAGMNLISGILIYCIVFLPMPNLIEPVIESFTDCSLVDDAGLQVGDRFVEVDGETIYVYSDVTTMLTVFDAPTHDILVQRNGELVLLEDFPMTPHTHVDENGVETAHYGFSYAYGQPDLGRRIEYVWQNTVNTVRNVRLSLQMLATGKAGLDDMTGPVGIVSTMTEVAEQSGDALSAFMNVLNIGGFLAINLAVMNLLPIPALDGGRVVGLLISTAYTGVTKKELDPKYEGVVHGVGMILLLVLMGIIMFKDIFVIITG